MAPLVPLSPVTGSPTIVHGTTSANWGNIVTQGLQKGSGSDFVHFVPYDQKSEGGAINGLPVTTEVLVYVDMAKAQEDGIDFQQRSDSPEGQVEIVSSGNGGNGIVPPIYFLKAVETASNNTIWLAKRVQQDKIREMKLYSNARVQYTLRKAIDIAYEKGDDLLPTDFIGLDQLHYLGNDCLDDFFTRYAPHLTSGSTGPRVLDIGSGAGGPIRYMCSQYKARGTGVEFLHEFYKIFKVLNRLMGIPSSTLRAIEGDINKMDQGILCGNEGKHHAFTAQLAILHIVDKATTFKVCAESLTEDGVFMIEDYHRAADAELDPMDSHLLARDVSVPEGSLLTEKEWRDVLGSAGFEVEEFIDMTPRWCKFIWDRCETFFASEETLEAEHGREYVDELGHFYASVAALFHKVEDVEDFPTTYPLVCQKTDWNPSWKSKAQVLRGCRIYGRKKQQ